MNDADTHIFDPSEIEDEDIGGDIGYDISSYGADFSVEALVTRMRRGNIFIPDCQRQFIWTLAQASRFLESMILGLPVPGIFLYQEPGSKRRMVVDGQRRLLSLKSFYDGVIHNREFKLRGVCKELDSESYSSLNPDTRRRLDDSVLHATVFYQFAPTGDRYSIYEVFERLNSGRISLSAQQIRTRLFNGRFEDMLKELNETPVWRRIFGSRTRNEKDKELILRIFAFKHRIHDYSRPLKQFLNRYMDSNANASKEWVSRQKASFIQAVSIAVEFGTREMLLRGKVLNIALTEAILVGLWCRVEDGPIANPYDVDIVVRFLRIDDEFVRSTERKTTTRKSVQTRIMSAIEAFSKID